MKALSSFRAKLILTIFPVVAGVTTGALLLAELKFSATYRRLFEEQFEGQIAAVTEAKNKRFEALSNVLERMAQKPETIAAMREKNFFKVAIDLRPALESLAQERLQSEFGNPARPQLNNPPRPGGNPQDRRDERNRPSREPQRNGNGNLNAPFIALMDAQGEFVLNQRNRSNNPLSELTANAEDSSEVMRRNSKMQWLSGRPFEEVLKQQEVGYLVVEAGERRGEQVREVFITPFRDPADGRFLGAFVFGLPLPALADRVLYEQSKQRETGEIMGGIYVEGKLVSTSVPDEKRDLVVETLAKALNRSDKDQQELILPIGSAPHRLIYRTLNPDSPFPQAVQVNFYSLAPLQAEIADLRRSAFGLGIIALLVAFLLVMFISRGLSGPVSKLVLATQEIERGNYDIRVPVTPNEVGRLAQAFNEMAAGLALQEKYRSVLNAVADRTVAERLIENREALGGELREVSMLFCDIRGFTSLTEKMPPHEVIELLNEHMTALTQVAYDHGGIVDKFVGDLIMVLFGAPLPLENDALNAVHCAQSMLQVRRELNNRSRHPLEIGIGVASGSVVAGCMGSEQRLSYTVLGHRVNLASRLCSIAQAHEILVDAETAQSLTGHVTTSPMPPMQLKGFSEPVAVHRVE